MSLALHGALSVIGYFTVNIGVGLWAAGRRIQPRTPLVDENVPDYLLRLLLANRALPLSLGFISMTATWVGGGYVYGTAEAVFNYGLAWCHAPVGYAFSLLIGGVMFCEKMRAQKPLTMLDPFQAHYGRWIAVPLSLPAVLGELFWTAANLAALGESVSIIADLDPALAIVVSGSTILLYTSVGGLISVVYTDVLQALTTLVGLWACVPAVASSSATDRIRLPSYSWLGQIEIKDVGQMLDLLLMTTLGGIPWQVYFQQVLASDSRFAAQVLSYMSAAGCVIYAAPSIFIGATAKTSNFTMAKYAGRFDLEPADKKNVLPLSMHHLASGWASIGGQLSIVAAVMSSVDSSMFSASSLVAHNIYYCVARRKASEGERAIVLRCAVLLLGAVATVIALATNSVFALWTQSSELCYVLLFPQFIALFFLQRYSNAYGAVLGFLIGITARVLCGAPDVGIPVLIRLPLYDSEHGQQFPFRTLCMLISLVAIPVTSVLTGYVFDTGLLPPDWDVWNCLGYAKIYADDMGAKTVPAESSRKIVTNVGTRPSAALTPRDGFTPETPVIPLDKTKRGVASGNITAKTSAINTRTSTAENAATPTKRLSLSPSTDTKRRKNKGDLPSSAEPTTVRTGPTNTVPSPKQLGTGKSSNTANRSVGVSGIGTEPSAASAVPTGRSSSSFRAVTASERIPITEKPGEEEDKASAPLEQSTAISWFRNKRKPAKTRNVGDLATGNTSTGPATPSGRMSAQGTTATGAGKTAPATPLSIPGTTEGAGKRKAKETAMPKSTYGTTPSN